VRALLNGSKTQTRRIFKAKNGGVWPNSNDLPGMKQIMRNCPYGQPGDRLWVRETFCPIYPQDPSYNGGAPIEYDYAATYTHGDRLGDSLGIKKVWKPSIHMPRAASRITLEITGVRVERLQNISEADAIAEGIERGQQNLGWYRGFMEGDSPNLKQSGRDLKILTASPKLAYESLWSAINGPESWAANPWVWVVEFKRVEGAAA